MCKYEWLNQLNFHHKDSNGIARVEISTKKIVLTTHKKNNAPQMVVL